MKLHWFREEDEFLSHAISENPKDRYCFLKALIIPRNWLYFWPLLLNGFIIAMPMLFMVNIYLFSRYFLVIGNSIVVIGQMIALISILLVGINTGWWYFYFYKHAVKPLIENTVST